MNKYSVKHLNWGLSLRSKIRRWAMNPKNSQRGTFKGSIAGFLERLLDLNHQETFTCTIPNRYAQRDIDLLKGFHVPEESL